jgi:hypothetical protein
MYPNPLLYQQLWISLPGKSGPKIRATSVIATAESKQPPNGRKTSQSGQPDCLPMTCISTTGAQLMLPNEIEDLTKKRFRVLFFPSSFVRNFFI